MPGEIFDFIWYINDAGYRLVEAETGSVDDLLVVANVQSDGGLYKVNRYNPLRQHKCLFRTFAEEGFEPERILDFANRFGLMGFDQEIAAAEVSPVQRNMESLRHWQLEISSIRKALNLWDMVQEEEKAGLTVYLEPFMEWLDADLAADGRPVAAADEDKLPEVEPEELRWFRTHPECLQWYLSGDLAVPALMRVQAIINHHLEKRISPRILWDDERRKKWSLYFVPDNLIGAIWLQLSQAVTQEKDYRRCRQCDTWFEIDHYTARSNRYFCSNACRSKAYRDRQAEARRLHGNGLSLEDIAGRLGSDRKTVTRWINA